MKKVESTVRPTALGLADKVVRLRERLRDPEWRRYGYLLMGGKMLRGRAPARRRRASR